MIHAVIIDDEQNNIESLRNLLEEFCPNVLIRGTARNADEGLQLIRQTEPQLVFLDIEMPFGNAFDMLEKLMPVNFEVIFVTAFEQYALKAIRYVALDYLLKPVNIDELVHAVNRARLRISEKQLNNRIGSLLENLKPDSAAMQKIGIPTHDGFSFERLDQIIRLQAEASLSIVYLTDKKITASRTLKEFELLLPARLFCRVHHAHLVNLNFVKKYTKGRGGYIELTDGTTLEVSARKKEEFLEKFGLGESGRKPEEEK